MSKIELFGPRQLLLPVLSRLRRFGVLYIEKHPDSADDDRDAELRSLEPDESSADSRNHFQSLKQKIETLLSRLPATPGTG